MTFPAGNGVGYNAWGPYFVNAQASTIDLTLDNIGKGPLPPTGRTIQPVTELLNGTGPNVPAQGLPAVTNSASALLQGLRAQDFTFFTGR